ncbi:MAG: NAD(P)/FAD-dependent oxidoreductase [Chloroflexota bacterium]
MQEESRDRRVATGDPAPYDGFEPLPTHADVVVIGGGVAGTSVAYQLSKRGHSVVLLEMRGICSGASGRNAGQTGSGGSSLASKEGRAIHKLTSENFRMVSEELPAELGDDFDLRVTGIVDIAQNEEQWEYLVESVKAVEQLDPDVRLLDGAELRDLIPAAADHLLGAKHVARSGHLWPFKLVHGLAGGARKHGAKIHPWTPVQEILTSDSEVSGVRTARGMVETGTVVLATNAWTPTLLPDLPEGAVVAARGQIIVTEPVAPILPLAFGSNFDKEYGRQTATGQLICGGFRRYDVDEGLGHYGEDSVAECIFGCARCLTTMFPTVRRVKVARAWAGTMGFTADGLPLIGSSSMAGGLYISAGYNGSGFSWNLAVGKALGELIAEGETAFDLTPFDPDRFFRDGVEWRNPSTAGEQNNPRSMRELQA